MTPEQIALVTQSVERVRPRATELSAQFYDRFFATDPDVRAMFPDDMAAQERKFVASLDAIVAAIPDFSGFTDRAGTLGRLHVAHHVTARQYAEAGGALLACLSEADPAWDDEIAAAWAAAYDLVAESMMLGGRPSS